MIDASVATFMVAIGASVFGAAGLAYIVGSARHNRKGRH